MAASCFPSGAPTLVAPLFLHFAHSGDESQNMALNPHCVQAAFIILLLPRFCISESDCVALKHLQRSRDELFAGGCPQHSHVNGVVNLTPPLLLVSADEIREPFCSQTVEDWLKYRGQASNDREQKAAFFFLKAGRLKGSKSQRVKETPLSAAHPPPFFCSQDRPI